MSSDPGNYFVTIRCNSRIFVVALKYRTGAYRAVYDLQLEDRVWVLHAFEKKATQGIKTPKKEIDLVGERLKRLKKELRT